MKKIFVDNASTTKVDEEVIASMLPYFSKLYGNPSSLHYFGREALEGLNKSRNKVANLLHAKDNEIIFTAGGTESDNIAIKGVVYNHKNIRKLKGPHIITSTIEHPAVLETCKHLETQGFKIHYLPVDKFGLINIDDLQKSLSKNTILITIMYANNEIGTIEPVKEIGAIAKENNIPYHTDAVQAIGKVPIDVNKLNIDMLSISSHKIYGPKGTGALYIKEGVKLQSIVHGGGHESGLRSSTHNMPGIIGLGKACELAKKRMTKDIQYLKKLRDYLINNILQIEESYLNGHPEKRLVNNAHFRFSGIEGEALIMRLDENGVATSTGSACSSRKLDTSHVLKAIGLGPVESQGSVRITIGRNNTEDEVTHVSKVLPKIVDELRVISPLWN